jgi:hypothetical protein
MKSPTRAATATARGITRRTGPGTPIWDSGPPRTAMTAARVAGTSPHGKRIAARSPKAAHPSSSRKC